MSRPKIGDVITKPNGSRWRVVCESETSLGLEPVGLFHRLYWWWKLR